MKNLKDIINIKTVLGVGVGVTAGYFLIKTKKPLYLIGLGVIGGVISNTLIKTKAP